MTKKLKKNVQPDKTSSKPKQSRNARTRRKARVIDWGNSYLAALATTCHCAKAAIAVGVNHTSVWRRRKNDPKFEAAYQEALKIGAELLEAEAVRRASEGLRRMKFNAKTGEAYIDPETQKPYIEHEYSDTLMLALLKRHFPDQYRERSQVDQHLYSGDVPITIHACLPPIVSTPPPIPRGMPPKTP